MTIAAVVLVGCGESQQTVPAPEAKPIIPILEATSEGNIEVVKQYLADKTHQKGWEFQQLLELAVIEGHKEIAELLISKGADVNAKDYQVRTPLIEAINGNQIELIEFLIEKGADVNAKDNFGKTPLDDAEELWEDDRTKVNTAKKETANLLRKHGGKTGEELKSAEAPDISIDHAAKDGNIQALKQHLAAGTDVNAKNDDGVTPLIQAAYRGHKEIAELLIKKGANVNAKDHNGETPLDVAEGETADLLRKHGGKTSAWLKADESIHIAVEAGHIEAVKKHLVAGTDVNVKTISSEFTPLDSAAYFGQTEIGELLIAEGADVNAKDHNGETPLDWSINQKYTSITDLLRKHGGKTSEELKAEGK